MTTTSSTSGRTSQIEDPAVGGDVVVGFEGTWHSAPALERAATEAVARGRALTLLTVVSTADDPDVSSRGQQAEATSRWETATRDGDEGVDAVRRRHPGLTVTLAVVLDSDTERLQLELDRAGLLVVGTDGRDGPRAFLMGSNSRTLARGVACPLLVVPEGVPHRHQPHPVGGAPDDSVLTGSVVVGLRRGPEAVGLVRFAADEAARRGARLCVAHAYTTTTSHAQAERDVEQLVVEAGLAGQVPVTTIVTPDAPADALLGLGARADLLVVGSRGPLALARLATGSVSRAVLDGTDCPFLLVPHPVARSYGLAHPGVTS